MKQRMATYAAAITALACAASLRAHHSSSMFDLSMPIWVKGTVVSYAPVNPHVMIALDVSSENGQLQRWTVEGPWLRRLEQMNLAEDFLKAGDVIEVCGFPFKEEFRARSSTPDSDGARLPAVHAHLLMLPNERLQPWGPYGKLDNCVRPNDRTQPWLDLVNSDPMGREDWCRGRTFGTLAPSVPRALLDEIDRLITEPCE